MPLCFLLKIVVLLTIQTLVSQCQAPIQANFGLVVAQQLTLTIPTPALNPHTIPINPTAIPIPPQAHRKPFITLSSFTKLQSQGHSKLHMLTEIVYVSTAQFLIRLHFVDTGGALTSWVLLSTLKFNYVLISAAFADVYLSAQLEIFTGSVTFNNLADSRTFSYTLNTWLSLTTPPFDLTLSTVKFVYSIMHADLDSLNSNDQYSLSFTFFPTSADKFNCTLTSAYAQKISSLRVSLFVYDKAGFDANFVSVRSDYQLVPAFGQGTTPQLFTRDGWDNYPGMHIITSIVGFQFSGYPSFGIDLTIPSVTYHNILTLHVTNFFQDFQPIPKVQAMFMSISILKCPNNEPLVDQSMAQCLSTCPAGYNPSTTVMGYTGLVRCQACATCCAQGFYLNAGVGCTTCPTGCAYCSTVTFCITCASGYVKNAATGQCEQASACLAPCTACGASGCTGCISGFDLVAGACVCPIGSYASTSTTCAPCSSVLINCAQCDSAINCQQCQSGFYLQSPAVCQSCSANCVTCTAVECQVCETGFTIFPSTTSPITMVCKDCKILYGECSQCDQTICAQCLNGFFWLTSTKKCESVSSIKCGDGTWIEEYEDCDDGNADNGDGCDSQCKPQADYVCLPADKLASGSSFCKFTKDLSLQFSHLSKDPSSNILHLFMTLQPSTFTQWTQATITSLLTPLSIINPQSTTPIPINTLTLTFHRNHLTNLIEVTIDYGQNNLEGSCLKFGIDPASTNIQALQGLTKQSDVLVRIDSEKTGVFLYGYGEEVYAFQGVVKYVAAGVGFLSLLMACVGCWVPGGKLIVLEALAVVQIGFFLVLQFKKIPPTFVGLQNLVYSNGYSIQGFLSPSGGVSEQNIYKLMGLDQSILSNFNLSFVIFVITPALIGSLGLLITKCMNRPQSPLIDSQNPPIERNTQNDAKSQKSHHHCEKTEFNGQIDQSRAQSNFDPPHNVLQTKENAALDKTQLNGILQTTHNPQVSKAEQINEATQKQSKKGPSREQILSLVRIIFERILYQNTFYGIMLTSYLAWVSAFHSFSSLQIASIVVLVLFVLFGLGFGSVFVVFLRKFIPLNEIFAKPSSKVEENLTNCKLKSKDLSPQLSILTRFGQFSDVYTQVVGKQNQADTPYSKLLTKFYGILFFQRIVSSACIVFLGQSTSFLGAFIAIIYLALLVTFIVLNKKYKKTEQQKAEDLQEAIKQKEQKQSPVNGISFRIEKKDDFSSTEKEQKPSSLLFFYQNYVFRQSFNFATVILIEVVYLYGNVVMTSQANSQTFVNNFVVTKLIPMAVLGLLALNLFFNLFLWIIELKFDQILTKTRVILARIFPQRMKVQTKLCQQTAQQKHYQSQKQQDQVVLMMNKFLAASATFKGKDSPFLGIEQKEASKDALLSLFKAQQKQKIVMSPSGAQLRNKLIDEFWDEI